MEPASPPPFPLLRSLSLAPALPQVPEQEPAFQLEEQLEEVLLQAQLVELELELELELGQEQEQEQERVGQGQKVVAEQRAASELQAGQEGQLAKQQAGQPAQPRVRAGRPVG